MIKMKDMTQKTIDRLYGVFMSKHHKLCKWQNYTAFEFSPCPFCRIEELEEKLAIENKRWQTFPVDILELRLLFLKKHLPAERPVEPMVIQIGGNGEN